MPKLTASQPEDALARESDVIVSTSVMAYTEIKGFFVNVVSGLALMTFVVWAVVPDEVFEDHLAFDYFPDKYWVVAVPSYSLMLMVFVYVALAMYHTEVLTLPLDDVRNFVDDRAVVVGHDETDYDKRAAKLAYYVHNAPSGVWDLPITLANEVLYNDSDED